MMVLRGLSNDRLRAGDSHDVQSPDHAAHPQDEYTLAAEFRPSVSDCDRHYLQEESIHALLRLVFITGSQLLRSEEAFSSHYVEDEDAV